MVRNTVSLVRFTRNIAKNAILQALAEWEDGNPYLPPRYPNTTCTIGEIGLSGLLGRMRPIIGLRRVEAVWSQMNIMATMTSRQVTVSLIWKLRSITYRKLA